MRPYITCHRSRIPVPIPREKGCLLLETVPDPKSTASLLERSADSGAHSIPIPLISRSLAPFRWNAFACLSSSHDTTTYRCSEMVIRHVLKCTQGGLRGTLTPCTILKCIHKMLKVLFRHFVQYLDEETPCCCSRISSLYVSLCKKAPSFCENEIAQSLLGIVWWF